MRKGKILIVLLIFGLYNLNAQNTNKIKVALEAGIGFSNDFQDLGLILAAEPKFNLNDNIDIGLRIGASALFGRNTELINDSQSATFDLSANSSAVFSVLPTIDYYLKEYRGKFNPYLGVGIGYYFLGDAEVLSIENGNTFNADVNGQVGFLLRGGFETGRLRLGIEYNLIPKADIQASDGNLIGRVDDSYFGVTIGILLGGGKNQNK